MRTKEQIFEFIATELKKQQYYCCSNFGQWRWWITLLQGDSEIYQFSGKDGYKVQILTY